MSSNFPPDPFKDEVVIPDAGPLHDFYLALVAGGFEKSEAILFLVTLITKMAPEKPEEET